MGRINLIHQTGIKHLLNLHVRSVLRMGGNPSKESIEDVVKLVIFLGGKLLWRNIKDSKNAIFFINDKKYCIPIGHLEGEFGSHLVQTQWTA